MLLASVQVFVLARDSFRSSLHGRQLKKRAEAAIREGFAVDGIDDWVGGE